MRIPFLIETAFNKVFKPQIVTIVETFINDKPSQKFYGKSLTANFLQILYNHFNAGDADFNVGGAPFTNRSNVGKNTAGVVTTVTQSLFSIAAGPAVATQGIVIGSGNTAAAPADFNLNTKIANGAGAGQLQYQTQTAPFGPTIAGANTSFLLERLFVNASGGNVSINELGIEFAAVGSFLIYRDVLGATDVIPNGGTYRVTITFQITT
jgi:hypothetical protein